MNRLAFVLAFVCLPAAAQDPGRGKLLYELHCGGCHYERVHERDRDKTVVHSLSDLRDQVARRAAQTARQFTLEDLADIAEYLNRSYYRLSR
jgi:mono/diheme cytochrome c family protein